MAKNEFCQVWLSCANKEEASKIAKALLNQHLIACAKQMPITSDYWWQNDIEHADEVLLLMDAQERFFGDIDAIVARLHSYKTYVLYATPISNISIGAQEWLKEEADGEA